MILSGNAAVVIASESRPLPAVTLTEVLATSDVPGGVVNLITGLRRELVTHLAGHMDVNALDAYGAGPRPGRGRRGAGDREREALRASAGRRRGERSTGSAARAQSPYLIGEFVETKTVWHPIGS